MSATANLSGQVALQESTSAPQFLMITGTVPGEPGVGGVFLDSFVDLAGAKNGRCFWLSSRHGRAEPYRTDFTTIQHQRRYETAFRPWRGIAGELTSALSLRLLRPRMVRDACRTLSQEIARTRPDCLLAVLESPAAIQVALAAHERSGIPLHSIVWDDIDVACRQAMFDRWTRKWMEKSFGDVLKASDRVAVISENMQEAYKRDYGIDSFVLRLGVPLDAVKERPAGRPERDRFEIGFAGTNTAPDCMASLLQSLDDFGWRLHGKDVTLRLLGGRHVLDSRRPQRIEFLGWQPTNVLYKSLADCDLLYLPQSFAPEHRTFSELSFPTKLSTYIAARRPIMLQAPKYASLAGFWDRHELGPYCDSLDANRIIDALNLGLSQRNSHYQNWIDEIRDVHSTTLSHETFANGVRKLVGQDTPESR